MIGEGKHHREIPTDIGGNLRWRSELMRWAAGQPARQQEVIDKCAADILYYINGFVWQFNPKKRGPQAIRPFIAYDFQARALLDKPEKGSTAPGGGAVDEKGKRGLLWCYENGRTCAVEKSREMGISWLFLIFQDWLCQFHDYVQTLNISRDADAVDCASPDSLFWKLRYIHQQLPSWMIDGLEYKKMMFRYRRTGSFIGGEASTGKAGVGGRASLIFVDEFQLIREATEVRQRTANTSDCRFFNGTHLGTGTEFYRMCDPEQSPEVVRITLHWSQHPEKNKGLYRAIPGSNRVELLDPGFQFPEGYRFVADGSPTGGPFPGLRSPWYDAKCLDIGSERGVAVELDINPTGSVEQFFDPIMIRQLSDQYCLPPRWVGNFDVLTRTFEAAGDGLLSLWVNLVSGQGPVPGKYVLGCDVSAGTGATPSVIEIANIETGEQVGEYANANIEPREFAEFAVALAQVFADQDGNAAKLIWENKGPGRNFAIRVLALGFRNIYRHKPDKADKLDATETLSPGWNATPEEKLQLLTEFRSAVQRRQYLVRSARIFQDCLKFKYDSSGYVVHTEEAAANDPSGARVNHSDRAIAAALDWKVMSSHVQVREEKQKEHVPVNSLAWRRRMAETEREEADAWD